MRVIVIGGTGVARAVIRAVNGKKDQQCNAVDALEEGTEVGPPIVDSDESWEASAALLGNQ